MKTNEQKVLVVGTTPDYIEWLRQTRPGKALFLTDYSLRRKASEPVPSLDEEILSCLDDEEQVKGDLLRHIRKRNTQLAGIVCFDCESMELTAVLAKELGLTYPELENIRLTRDKFRSKKLWQQNGVRCPQARLVSNGADVFAFMEEIDQPCVLKPLTGSGSELVFLCTSKKDCEKWSQVMCRELKTREANRLYTKAREQFIAEEYVHGTEYSCDFIADKKGARVIRLTRKIRADGKTFGTIAGYALTEYPALEFSADKLETMLGRAAQVLGIERTICMVDFLVTEDEIVLLEMTPRAGGDCIPHLLRSSGRIDILSVALDYAAKHTLPPATINSNGRYVGVRLHAKRPGQIIKVNTQILEKDPRIKEIHLIRKEGHRVNMPPVDYDSWYLGHVIFQPFTDIPLEEQCFEIRRELVLETAS